MSDRPDHDGHTIDIGPVTVGEPLPKRTPDRPDLDALADALLRGGWDDDGEGWDDIVECAARILRAVAAAPGPLKGADFSTSQNPWGTWIDALGDAVGEP